MSRRKAVSSSLMGAGVAAATAIGAYLLVVGPWQRRWGATDAEVDMPMPGDERIPGANFATTRAITIQAPPEKVWPWLAQMGQGRGGLYSYDFLENLVGLDFHSTRQVLPQFQEVKPGDVIPLEPGGTGYKVAEVEPNRRLVLHAAEDDFGESGVSLAGGETTWVFLLQPLGNEATRLIVRWRARFPYWRSNRPQIFLIGLALDPVEFLMERKMMLGIKERAEAQQSAPPEAAPPRAA